MTEVCLRGFESAKLRNSVRWMTRNHSSMLTFQCALYDALFIIRIIWKGEWRKDLENWFCIERVIARRAECPVKLRKFNVFFLKFTKRLTYVPLSMSPSILSMQARWNMCPQLIAQAVSTNSRSQMSHLIMADFFHWNFEKNTEIWVNSSFSRHLLTC